MDYLEIRELYHADLMEKEKARIISEFEIFNTDFLDDLPYQVRNVLDSLKWRFRTEDWFPEAWEKYRQHVLEAGLGGEIKMPGYIFNPYLERYADEHFRESNNNLGECRYSDMEIGEYLAHHGIKGQKWGIRRFQNEDGSLTAEGKQRYGYNESTGKMSRAGKIIYKSDIKSNKQYQKDKAWAGQKKLSYKETLPDMFLEGAGLGVITGTGVTIATGLLFGHGIGEVAPTAFKYGVIAAGAEACATTLAAIGAIKWRNDRIDIAKARLSNDNK